MTTMRVVAIDGPAGSGKSTVSRAVAAKLGLEVLDTGAMYRAATVAALRAGLALDDADALRALVERTDIEVGARVTIDGIDVSACATAASHRSQRCSARQPRHANNRARPVTFETHTTFRCGSRRCSMSSEVTSDRRHGSSPERSTTRTAGHPRTPSSA